MAERTIVVVGAGMAGLAAAHEIRKRRPEASFLVVDANVHPGGVVGSGRADGWLCGHAANGWLESPGDPGAPPLARSLGIDVLASAPEARRRWIWRRGALRQVPSSPPGILRTRLLGFRGKLRLLREPFVRRGHGEESVAAFARRRLGREATDALVV